jgi:hypothetical protein
MIRTMICLAVVGVVAVPFSVGASAQPAGAPVLRGTVGPGFTISLKRNGTRVRTLRAGRYTFVISDRASNHNFVLERKTGGEFEKALTGVPFVGKKTATVRLKRGRWKFYCRPHEATMFGFFRVT